MTTDLTTDWMNRLPRQEFFSSCQTACFLFSVREQCISCKCGFEWHWLCVCACECKCVCLHAWGPTVCVFACHVSVNAVHKHEHNVLQYVWAEAGTIADCLVCFLFFFPLPFSCPRFDYNQVFFLILQWAKEQHTVQRASQWAASCWTVSNTWGSDQLVSPSS